MEVVYWSKRRKPEVEFAMGVKYIDLDAPLSTSDFVVVTLALTPETERFFDRVKLAKMKRGAYFINVGEGKARGHRGAFGGAGERRFSRRGAGRL